VVGREFTSNGKSIPRKWSKNSLKRFPDDIAMEMQEEMAKKAAPFIYITGLDCIAGLVLLISLVASGLTSRTAVLGDQIRHPRFRPKTEESPDRILNE